MKAYKCLTTRELEIYLSLPKDLARDEWGAHQRCRNIDGGRAPSWIRIRPFISIVAIKHSVLLIG
jgi:hypothetical protein